MTTPEVAPEVREALIIDAARVMHTTTSHPDYPDYDEAPCCGTPAPVLVNPPQYHHESDHEKASRGVCWACEPVAAAAIDALLASDAIAALKAEWQAEALEEAAGDPGLRLAGHSGVSVRGLRDRAARLRGGES